VPELAAVLFDMDGTIVDTEPYWIAAEYALVAEFGGQWSDAHAHHLVGSALTAAAAYIREYGGVPLRDEQIIDRLERSVIASMQQAIPWRPGARELLTTLRDEAVPCALVTMSYTALAMTVVDALHAEAFMAVVTGDEVTDGKPHPEPYLLGAARLGVDPEHCVAIEDSPTGVASAEAAGCVVLAVPHHLEIPAAPTRTLAGSLTDVTPASLRELVRRAGG
jgi:HAD superfamily hydrolase (TIGR01509 family)